MVRSAGAVPSMSAAMVGGLCDARLNLATRMMRTGEYLVMRVLLGSFAQSARLRETHPPFAAE